jgi:hypothetical protein
MAMGTTKDGRMRVVWSGLFLGVMAAALAGCGEDLGECNEALLGGSTVQGMEAPYTGQLVMQQSCSGGRCHSETAVGDARVGAPAGLDFDVVPTALSQPEIDKVTRGASNVADHIDEIWGEVNEGAMPPPAPAGGGELNATDKEALRNWLACGADVIAAPPSAAPGADPWTTVFESLVPSCQACHSTTAASAAGGGFYFGSSGEACGAYDRVVNVGAGGTACAGMGMLVVPGNAAGSLLYQKLAGTQTCGAAMPLGSMGIAMSNGQALADLEAWINSGAPRPAECP